MLFSRLMPSQDKGKMIALMLVKIPMGATGGPLMPLMDFASSPMFVSQLKSALTKDALMDRGTAHQLWVRKRNRKAGDCFHFT